MKSSIFIKNAKHNTDNTKKRFLNDRVVTGEIYDAEGKLEERRAVVVANIFIINTLFQNS
jgi:hypothetical protein